MAKRFLKSLARTDLFFWAIVYLMVLLFAGTLAQKWIGLYQAQEIYFAAWVIWVGGILPVPGTMAVMAFITLGLIARVFVYPWIWPKAGTIIVHFSALVLLIGGFVMSLVTEEGAIVLAEGESKDYVTDYFDVELVIGEDNLVVPQRRLFAGEIVRGEGVPFETEIVAFYQHAEPVMVDGQIGVKALPRLSVEEENLSALVVRVHGEERVLFEDLPMPVRVEHEGVAYEFKLRHVRRALPFAIELVKFEREVYPGTNQPRSYYSDVVVYDGLARWPSRIGMNEPLRYKGYSFYQSSFLQGGLGERSVLAVVKNEGRLFPYIASGLLALGLLVTVAQRWRGLMKKTALAFVLCAGALFVPQAAIAEEMLSADVTDQVFSIDDFSRQAVWRDGRVQPIETVARAVLRDFSGQESLGFFGASEWLALVFFAPEQAAVLPVFKVRQPEVLHAIGLPWRGSAHLHSFTTLREAMAARMDELGELWQIAPEDLTPAQRDILDLQRQLILYAGLRDLEPAPEGSYDLRRVQAEWFYERLGLHFVSVVFYVLAGLALLVGVFRARLGACAAAVFLGCGFFVHAVALAMRVYILGRPPVSSLYESIIFVGLVVVLAGLAMAWRYRSENGLLIGAVGGGFLQMIGMSYAGSVQTMGVLVPVLNTNFWLATHVIVITVGYGLCLVAGMLAHMDLWRRMRFGAAMLEKQIIAFALLALLFTAVGTILGGIWADQSWGRFWGWDPKENGAMLICLWLIACLHGRLGGVFGTLFFVTGVAFLPVIVALAWFGVNLLNVGLHSYGFTDGIALGLFGFVALEIVIIMTIVWGVVRKRVRDG